VVLTRPKYRQFAISLALPCLLTGCIATWAQSPTVQELLRSGQAALDADDYPRAAASFEHARQIAPDNLPANRGLVLSLLQLGRLTEATQIGREAVARWPQDAQLQHWLGLAYFKAGQKRSRAGSPVAVVALESGHFDIHFDCLGLPSARPL
jgi:Flp pilus assembly protein TadD